MTPKIKVYVAGPYTKPDPCINTHNAIKVANALMDAGLSPFLPHLSHFWHTVTPKPYQEWLDLDFEWITVCQVLYRMPGESSGADKEVALAESLGIPVFRSLQLLLEWAAREAS